MEMSFSYSEVIATSNDLYLIYTDTIYMREGTSELSLGLVHYESVRGNNME